MGFTLTSVGLLIASGILLIVVCSLIASNPWQETEELHAVARNVATRVQDMDSRFYENTFVYQCPLRTYQYTIQLSTEYVTVSAKNIWGETLSVKERFIVHPWPRNDTMNWTTGYELHCFLNETYGHWGTSEDPLPLMNLSEFENDRENCTTRLASYPLSMRVTTPLYFEKVSLFDDAGEKHDTVLLYQIK